MGKDLSGVSEVVGFYDINSSSAVKGKLSEFDGISESTKPISIDFPGDGIKIFFDFMDCMLSSISTIEEIGVVASLYFISIKSIDFPGDDDRIFFDFMDFVLPSFSAFEEKRVLTYSSLSSISCTTNTNNLLFLMQLSIKYIIY